MGNNPEFDSPTGEYLRVALLCREASAPSLGSAGAVGYDLRAVSFRRIDAPPVRSIDSQDVVPLDEEAIDLEAGGMAVARTGIAVAVPAGHYGRVAPRSGLALKGIDVLAGVVDPDYRGEVMVVLVNVGRTSVRLSAGNKIAQLLLERCAVPPVHVVQSVADLGDTVRGHGGFGSTGLGGGG